MIGSNPIITAKQNNNKTIRSDDLIVLEVPSLILSNNMTTARQLLFDNTMSLHYIIFIKQYLSEIMKMLGCDNKDYCVGGSIAAMLYGVNIRRTPHDVDVIVPSKLYKYIEDQVKRSIFFRLDNLTSSNDAEFSTQHFSFRTASSITIDVIANDNFDSKDNIWCGYVSSYIASPKHLLEAKKKYRRPKDRTDEILLEDLVNTLEKSKEELDPSALETLKKKLAGEN